MIDIIILTVLDKPHSVFCVKEQLFPTSMNLHIVHLLYNFHIAHLEFTVSIQWVSLFQGQFCKLPSLWAFIVNKKRLAYLLNRLHLSRWAVCTTILSSSSNGYWMLFHVTTDYYCFHLIKLLYNWRFCEEVILWSKTSLLHLQWTFFICLYANSWIPIASLVCMLLCWGGDWEKRACYTLFAHVPSSLGGLHTTPLH